MPTNNKNSRILALDVGESRIGLALNIIDTTIAKPYGYFANNADFIKNLTELIEKESIMSIVVGLPRGLSGQDTDQTRYVRNFVDKLKEQIKLDIYFQDEALTSVKAQEILDQQKNETQSGDIDSYSASIILQDFLSETKE